MSGGHGARDFQGQDVGWASLFDAEQRQLARGHLYMNQDAGLGAPSSWQASLESLRLADSVDHLAAGRYELRLENDDAGYPVLLESDAAQGAESVVLRWLGSVGPTQLEDHGGE